MITIIYFFIIRSPVDLRKSIYHKRANEKNNVIVNTLTAVYLNWYNNDNII